MIIAWNSSSIIQENQEADNCKYCPDNCQVCTNFVCDECLADFIKVGNSCIKCPVREFFDGFKCTKCIDNCTECSDKVTCGNCDFLFDLENGKCVPSSCPKGQYQNMQLSKCETCPENCLVCTSLNDCIKCKHNHDFNFNQLICQLIKESIQDTLSQGNNTNQEKIQIAVIQESENEKKEEGIKNNEKIELKAAPEGCLLSDFKNSCQKCTHGFFMEIVNFSQNSFKCVKCPQGCAHCTRTICQQCLSNYQFSQTQFNTCELKKVKSKFRNYTSFPFNKSFILLTIIVI